MSEIGSGSGSSYPGALDTDNTLEVNSPNAGKTKARAEVPNDLAACIIALETELGTDPAGSLTDVKTFLQTQHTATGTHTGITTNTLSATGQITSTLATGTAPLVIASTTEVANLKAATATTANQLTDGTNTIRTKIINIGDWNMDTTAAVAISHGLTFTKIRSMSAIIRNDADSIYSMAFTGEWNGAAADVPLFLSYANSTTVLLTRGAGSLYDGAAYDSTAFNRGWITITYID